ncbi:hypothetical protein PVAP13_1KG488200 [Panicum virgatum]|uniref:Uncharacterized protein n=1 Tax=Panicum virgatum TaxID=38727 RepID=A0A8T0Y1A8_PANVG|nr:hypothetical protein PVAP13_1KG488200 [Panicum virgatum]
MRAEFPRNAHGNPFSHDTDSHHAAGGGLWLPGRKNGPNPNSERAEETHRARDRNYTSFRAFREATTNSSEKEAATTTMIVPGSRAADEKNYFDSHLTLFYRIEQLSPSRFVQLKIKDSKSKLDAIKREIKNLQKTVVTMSKAIQDLKNHVDANIAKI